METVLIPRAGGSSSRPVTQMHLFLNSLSTEPKANATHLLQEVNVNIVEHNKCNELLKKGTKSSSNAINEGGLCAYGEGKDSCQVSSGAPC